MGMWAQIGLGTSFCLLVVSLYYNFKFGVIILHVQDSIEESLDVIDERYASISRILKIPIYYDSPEIRTVLKDIEQTRDSILYIANQLAKVETTIDDAPQE